MVLVMARVAGLRPLGDRQYSARGAEQSPAHWYILRGMSPRTAKRAAAVLGAVAAALFLAGVATGDHALRMAAKPWPVLLMAVVVFAAARHRYGRLVGAGLLACLAGDVLLETGPSSFLHGVGAFFVGHVLYTAAYLGRSRALRPLSALPFAVWGLVVLAALRPGLAASGMLVPVAAYCAAIMVMAWRATACWEPGGVSAVTVHALAGALLFAASDTMLAVNRFGEPFTGARYAIMVSYWAGQLGITLSALRLSQRGP